MMNEMSPRERVGAFLGGKPIDRTPCVPLILNHAARVLGVPVRDYATDGLVMGRAQVAAYRRYGQDLITIFADTAILAEAMGTELYFPPDDVARVVKPLVANPEDVVKLKPIDVHRAGRLGLFLKAIRHCVQEVGDQVFVSCCYPAPFSTAAALRGTAQLARDIYKNPTLVRRLLDASTQAAKDFAEAIAECGGVPVPVDPVASGSVLSRKAFDEFARPGIVEVLQKIREVGMPTVLHVCGRTSGIIDRMADSGAMVLSIDQIALTEAVEKVGDKVCLMGNVRPAETLLGGTPETVRAEARECLRVGKRARGGFILASGCEVPIETPPANLDALMSVVKEAG